MHKVAVLLSAAAVMVATLGLVPVAAAKKHKEDSGRGLSVADENDISVAGGGKRAEAAANDYHGQRFPERYATEEAAMAAAAAAAAAATKAPKQSSKQHNAKLLNRLGMKRVRTSGGAGAAVDGGNAGVGNHHRKRLASQSRSKYGSDGGKGGSDSQMFVVKLPPHAHFYGDGSAAAAHQTYHQQQQPHPQTPYKSLNTVPVGFVSNGKPAKVYHWNLPVIKHAFGGNRYRSGGAVNDVAQQQLHQLQYGDFELPSSSGSKVMPRRTLYYKPRASGKPVKKSFVNNGKPNGFYVVSAGKNAAAAAAAVPQYHKIVKAYYGSGDD